jgi:hypothetical protein
MAHKRIKYTLVKFTAAGYGGYTGNVKTTNSVSYTVLFVGNKDIEKRVEVQREEIENCLRDKYPNSEFELRVKAKIKNSFYADYVSFEDDPHRQHTASITNNHNL